MPNFRHVTTLQQQENLTQSDLPIETTPPVVFYRRRLQLLQTSIHIAGEHSLLICSRYRPSEIWTSSQVWTLLHVYKWYQDLQKTAEKHPYDQLHWGSFISTAITLRINALMRPNPTFRRNHYGRIRTTILEN
jgi:hypothetical protein